MKNRLKELKSLKKYCHIFIWLYFIAILAFTFVLIETLNTMSIPMYLLCMIGLTINTVQYFYCKSELKKL